MVSLFFESCWFWFQKLDVRKLGGESIVPAVRGLGREVNFSSNNEKVRKIDGLNTSTYVNVLKSSTQY